MKIRYFLWFYCAIKLSSNHEFWKDFEMWISCSNDILIELVTNQTALQTPSLLDMRPVTYWNLQQLLYFRNSDFCNKMNIQRGDILFDARTYIIFRSKSQWSCSKSESRTILYPICQGLVNIQNVSEPAGK